MMRLVRWWNYRVEYVTSTSTKLRVKVKRSLHNGTINFKMEIKEDLYS